MTVKVKTVDAQIRSLEEELKVLKTLTGYPPKWKKEKKTFSSLKRHLEKQIAFHNERDKRE